MPRNWLQTQCISAVAALASFGSPTLADESAKPTNKWRVEVDGTAKTDGTVTKKADQPDFLVELVSSSLENVRIEVEHD
jgi:hypothetical protein